MGNTTILFLDSVSRALEAELRSALDPEAYHLVVLEKNAAVDSAIYEVAEVLLCSDTDVDADLLDMTPNVRLIIYYQAGRSRIDYQLAKARNIRIVKIPCLALHTVAEFAVMSMLALPKKYVSACLDTRKQVWLPDLQPSLTTPTKYAYDWTKLVHWDSIYGKMVGLVGMGTIGQAVAQMLQGFGVDIVYSDIQRLGEKEERELDARYAPLDLLLQESDFVSLHVSLNKGTEGMMGMREFSLMKPTAFLINTSRGLVVKEDELAQALREGKLAGAALDVFRMEPLPTESPLWDLENVIITPHVAGIPVADAAKTEAAEIASLVTEC